MTLPVLTNQDIERICDDAVAHGGLGAPRMLVLIPDLTRSCPLDVMFRILYERLAGRAEKLDFLVALGTHPPLSMEQIYRRVGITPAEHREKFSRARFFNHQWNNPEQLVEVGKISGGETRALTDGLFDVEVAVTVNRLVLDYDQLLIVGPVFPHEVIGFSGGNKYIFPGISGPEILHFFHWLGAVITNLRIIGNKQTPVRSVVDHAVAMLPLDRRAFCMVVQGGGLVGLEYGTPEAAWSKAADLSSRVHVTYKDRMFHTVLSCAPEMYDELWVGGKCMYKLEPVVADGGKLIIYAPHIRDISRTHDALIRKIGYHTRDYFLNQWDKFSHIPWGILAHSTHVKGVGTFVDGVEKPRIDVVLATGLSEEDCRAINLGYMDHRAIDPARYGEREHEGVLLVPSAGEVLYRSRGSG